MTRNRASARSAGTRWESAIVEFLREAGHPYARRKAKEGAKDAGDVTPGDGYPVVIEAKDVSTHALAAWVAEANVEAEHAKVPVGVAWFHRRGKSSPGDGYVVMDGAAFARLLALVRRDR